ncbi:alpha carbonic anhydrase 1 isoform X2 [Tasmannia lanceolata]|uniref:alpha carbonic anhydrase 1 isoform X2 n=1 Tax=Tasmannia lanceolata TaxID=3420 RepID=UPI0040642955
MAALITSLFAGMVSLLIALVDAKQPYTKFGYVGLTGPAKWGSLSPDFYACSNGKHQSPINIVKKDAIRNPKFEPLAREYKLANATLVDNGFNVMLRMESDGGMLRVEGKNYTLKQMHWHSPSEHTINGIRFPAELHLVHLSDDGNFSVVAVLFQYGAPDPFLFQIKDRMKQLAKEVYMGDEAARVPVGMLKTKEMKKSTHKYFRYLGSLTTPPCTENVIWNVLGKEEPLAV